MTIRSPVIAASSVAWEIISGVGDSEQTGLIGYMMSQKLTTETIAYWAVRRRIWGSYSVVILITIGSYAFSRLLDLRSHATRFSQDCLSAVARRTA